MRRTMLLLGGVWAAAFAVHAQPAPANYICGGVGLDGQEAIKAQAPGHSLMLTFAATTGAYLADVDVQISDAKGNVVLSATCSGPIMLVDLPRKGAWHVRAQVGGVTREKTVTTGRGTARATLLWPAAS